nr:zinc finger, GRF-type [Tanacetum cinerariifolium]
MALCFCNRRCLVRCSWTPHNPGRRFYYCAQLLGTDCGFFDWVDPPMCARSTQIILGLLKLSNLLEESKNVLQEYLNLMQVANRILTIWLVSSWILFLVYIMYEGMHKAFKAKAKAEEALKADVGLQYGMLRDYVVELQKWNPNTIVKIDVYMDEDADSNTKKFKRIYVCLGALKDGFKVGGKDLIGLDGAFMKAPYEGQLLTVVSVDANNRSYPIAYGILESESLDS